MTFAFDETPETRAEFFKSILYESLFHKSMYVLNQNQRENPSEHWLKETSSFVPPAQNTHTPPSALHSPRRASQSSYWSFHQEFPLLNHFLSVPSPYSSYYPAAAAAVPEPSSKT